MEASVLAFTTECSVATTDCMNALQRVLEHVNYHVVTVKPPSPFFLSVILLQLFVCVHVTCVGLHCVYVTCGTALCICNVWDCIARTVCTWRSEGDLWGSVPSLFAAWDLGIPLVPSGLAAKSKYLSRVSLLASPQFLIITGHLLFNQ